MASKRIKGITVEISGDTTQLDKALKGTNDKIKDASANLRDVERLLKMDPGNLDLIKQKQKLLSDAIGETEEKLKVLKTAQEQAADALKKGTITPEQYDALGREIIECESSLKRLTGQQQTTDSATLQLTNKIKDQKTEINQLKNKYSDLLIEQGDTSEEAQALKEKIEKLSSELSTNEGKLKNAKDAANKLGDEFKDTDKNAENLGGELDTASKKAEKASDGGFTVLKGTLSNLASEGIQKVAGGLKDMVESVFDSAVDFESAWTGVTKTVDGTKEQYEKLQSDLWGISQSTASSITDIAQIAENAGQLGIATDDVANFTKIMTMLGDTTNLSADEASSAIAKLANITGLDSSQYSNLGSAIVDLGNNFATTEADIVEMTTRLASTANIAGFSTSDMLAMATALNSVGVEAEAGGTAISKTIKQMQTAIETGWWKKPTNKSAGVSLEDIAKIANVTESEFKKLAKSSPAKALALFIDGLSDTKRNGKSALVVLNDLGITEVRQSNALLALTKSNGLLTKAVDTSSKAWDDNTALTNEANKRYGTTASKIQQTKNRVEELKVQLGNKMLPTVEKVLGVIDKKAPKIEKVLEGVFEKGADLVSFCVDNAGTIETAFVGVGSILTAGFAINKIAKFTDSVSTLTGKMFKGIKTDANDAAGVGGVGTLLTKLGGAKGIGLIAVAGAASYALAELFSPAEYDFSKYDELLAKADEVKQKFDNWNTSKEEALSTVDADTKYYENLYQQLQNIVTENGKIKPEHEAQAKYIADELNPLLGDQKIAIENGIIKNWQNVNKEIKKTIQSQKILASIEAGEKSYKDALINMDDAQFAIDEASKALNKFKKDYNIGDDIYNLSGDVAKEYAKLNQTVIDARKEYETYAKTVDNYNALLEASNSGSVTAQEEALIRLKNNYGDVTKMSWDELAKQQSDVAQHWDAIQKEYHNGTGRISDETYAAWQTLYRETTDAFNKLSDENYQKAIESGKKYSEGLNSQKENVANSATSLKNAAENGMTSTNAANKGEKAASDYVQALGSKNKDGHLAGWKLANATYNGINDFFNKYSMSDAARAAISGWLDVIKNTKYLDQAAVAASQLGVATLQGIRESLDIHSPSRKMGQQAEYALAGWFNKMENFRNITKATESGAKIGMATISGIGNVLSANPKMNIMGTIDPQLTAMTVGGTRTVQNNDLSPRIGSDILAALSRLSIPTPNVTLGDTMLFIDGDEVAARIEYRQKSRQIRTNGRG